MRLLPDIHWSDHSSRVTSSDDFRRDVCRNNTVCADHRTASNSYAFQYDGVHTYEGIIFDLDRPIPARHWIRGTFASIERVEIRIRYSHVGTQ